jgi:hypothetical protein
VTAEAMGTHPAAWDARIAYPRQVDPELRGSACTIRRLRVSDLE